MASKDVISKELIRQLVKDMALYLLDLPIRDLQELPTEQHRIETRHVDIVMLATAEEGSQFILHLEMQDSNDASMPLRMMRYFTDIALSYPNHPIRQYVIYTGKNKLRMRDYLDQPNWRYRYHLIDMHTLDCDRFIQEDSPDALVMAILCDFQGRDSGEVLEGIMQRLIELTAQQPERMRNYLKMMETLSANRHLEDVFKRLEAEMLSKIDIEKLPSYQIGFDQGRHELAHEAASKLIALGVLTDRQIATATGLTIEQIDALRGKS